MERVDSFWKALSTLPIKGIMGGCEDFDLLAEPFYESVGNYTFREFYLNRRKR